VLGLTVAMPLLACGSSPAEITAGGAPGTSTTESTQPTTTGPSPAATLTTTDAATTTTDTDRVPAAAAPITTTAPPPTVSAPTFAPIVTHDAEIDVLTPQAVVAPVRVVIPSLGVDGVVEPTGVDAIGELAVPDDAKTLVWYRFGPTPGAAGSAVIAGHLDWKGVLGAFNTLADTPVGATVTVSYDDGTAREFVVQSVELVDKPAVSVNGTFARDGESVLRLVTCGGEFNDDVNRYYSNVVVTAIPV